MLTMIVSQCPCCGAATAGARPVTTAPMLGTECAVVACEGCGLLYKDHVPTEAGYRLLYHDAYEHFGSAARSCPPHELASYQAKLRTVAGHIRDPRGRSLLDVGCGGGGFVAAARELGWEAVGIDPYLPSRLEDDNLRRGNLADMASESFDAVTMLNVAEHTASPLNLFRGAHRVLRPGGALLLTCPYGNSVARRLYATRWVHLILDEHLLFWTPPSLLVALGRAGFGGRVTWRVGGSPFPCGWSAPRATAAPEGMSAGQARGGVPSGLTALSRLGRRIQQQAAVAGVARMAMHLLRVGDYLELVAVREDHS